MVRGVRKSGMGKAALLEKDRFLMTAQGRIAQVGAIVWRPARHGSAAATAPWGSGLEILLITSLGTGRWIIPKGWPKAKTSFAASAAEEAWEEAGVRGRIAHDPCGRFDYDKTDRGKSRHFTIDVYEIALEEQTNAYPEKDMRRRLWIEPQKAAALVDEPGLRALLNRFRPALSTG